MRESGLEKTPLLAHAWNPMLRGMVLVPRRYDLSSSLYVTSMRCLMSVYFLVGETQIRFAGTSHLACFVNTVETERRASLDDVLASRRSAPARWHVHGMLLCAFG